MTREGKDFTGPRLVAAVATAGAAALLYLGMAAAQKADEAKTLPQQAAIAATPVPMVAQAPSDPALRVERATVGPRKVRVVVIPRPRARARAS